MLERWCELIDRYLSACHVPERPLAGMSARVRHSHRPPLCDVGQAFEQALKKYGAEIAAIEDLSFELASEHGKARLADIGAYIMIAATTGVSAEALELAHAGPDAKPQLSDRLHVAMPKTYSDGFIRKRLDFLGVHLDLYDQNELDQGIVCARAISRLLECKRAKDGLEKAQASEFTPKIGIVTALPVEYEAMISLLADRRPQRLRKQPGNLHEYTHGTLSAFNGGKHNVVVARAGVGNNLSAAMTARLFDTFELDEVLMVGIAGGIPRMEDGQADIRFGDVVVSGRAGIVQYDMIKQKPGEAEPNHPPRAPSMAWLTRAQTLMTTKAEMDAFNTRLAEVTKGTPFKRPPSTTDKLYDDTDQDNLIPVPRPARRPAGRSCAHEGTVGSANIVVKSHADRERIRGAHKLLAVEMEGSGVADAAMMNGKPFFVIRGVCDYANSGKNNIWHPFAAMSAAVFAASLIQSMPLCEPE